MTPRFRDVEQTTFSVMSRCAGASCPRRVELQVWRYVCVVDDMVSVFVCTRLLERTSSLPFFVKGVTLTRASDVEQAMNSATGLTEMELKTAAFP